MNTGILAELSQQELRSLLDYNPDTGVFTRKVRTSNRIKVGGVAGTIHAQGYVEICVAGKYHKAHRLAWLYVYGQWPNGQIDHINGIRNDNRIENLRDVDPLTNARNRNFTRGYTKIGRGWQACIYVEGKRIALGTFYSEEDAHHAHMEAKRQYFPERLIGKAA